MDLNQRYFLRTGMMCGLCVLVLCQAGCGFWDMLDWKGNSPAPSCSTSASVAVPLGGTWRLTGNGEWTECREDRYDGVFVLGPSRDISVTQNEAGGLSVAAPIPSFELQGVKQGGCLSFMTREIGTAYVLEFQFKANLGASENLGGHNGGLTRVRGTFVGTGPQGCRAEGSFELEVR